ncbi:hypothetical protein O181_005913 [Austropuccinia psidii MF-1]|uniref:Uncharacterized protein n=1 Tax=Austropuccinia psidii MF-1 TaxID=1389203 RepID=A0A9Q3BJF8_9BASI|nr:hypothetical protein [Austropuccinia psidii MF-1]
MCMLSDRFVYGLPVPALPLLMALKALNETRPIREVVKQIEGSRLPKEIMCMIEEALAFGRAEDLRKEWWNSLQGSMSSYHEYGDETHGKERWLQLLSKDLLWEITDSNRRSLSPAKGSNEKEHELMRNAREYIDYSAPRITFASRTPLTSEFVGGETQVERMIKEEPVYIICLCDQVVESGKKPGFPNTESWMSVDLTNCEVDDLEAACWGFFERAQVPLEGATANNFAIQSQLKHLLRECDLVLGTLHGAGFSSCLDKQLGWWRVVEVLCDCDPDGIASMVPCQTACSPRLP